jgi:lipopolysaccharide export system permease protein
VTLGLRIITGVLVGLVFRYTQDAAGFASLLFHASPFWATLLPIALCLTAGAYAIYRVR